MSSDKPDDSFAALFEQTSRGTPRRGALRIGEPFDAVVVQVGKEAVFVEIGDRGQAFIDANDLRAPDGSLKVAVGDVVRARVAHVDAENGVRLAPMMQSVVAVGGSVSLGGGPDALAIKVALGQTVCGLVERVESYGLFLQIEGTKGRAGRGLLPTAELGTARGADLRKAFPLGTKLSAKVIEIGEGKLRLSVRALKDDEERAQFEGFREEGKVSTSEKFGTLGDLLKTHKKK